MFVLMLLCLFFCLMKFGLSILFVFLSYLFFIYIFLCLDFDMLCVVFVLYLDDFIVVVILDGSIFRMFLEDEDDFVMLVENFFIDLDMEDMGKISKNEI